MASDIRYEHTTCTKCNGSGSTSRVSGAWIREMRESAGMLQRELAERLGISVSYLCDIEVGRRTMSEGLARQAVGILHP